jgi:tetratricopeptide (TPR) repeat protein
VALGSAAFAFRRLKRNPLVPSFREAMQLLFTAVGSLTGLYATCLDPAQARRCVQVLEPLAVLGPNHPASIYYAACACVAEMATDLLGKTLDHLRGVLDRVQGDRPIARNMEEQTRRVRATMFYVWGILECWRTSSSALELADRLDGFHMKLYEMNADQIRTTYFAYAGNAEMFERYRQRVEMHAIARGSSWQVEIWTAATSVMLYLRTHDAVGMKRSIEQLQRLSPELPSLNVYVRRARGAYLLLREKYAEAIACLEPCLSEEPRAVAGWGSEHAALARAYNGLGEHRRAREVCRSALERLTPLDLSFVGMNLPLQIEHALADAGLGAVASAAEQVDGLLSLHASQGSPLTLGALHEARTRIALAASDDLAYREHLRKMESWYRSTGVPSVIQRCQQLVRANTHFSARPARSAGSESAELDRVLSEAVSLHECSERALAAFVRTSPTLQLYIFLNEPEGPRLTVQVGVAAPSAELVAAVEQRLRQAESMLGTTEIVDPASIPPESPALTIDQTEHRLTMLHAWDGDTEVVVAAALSPTAAGAQMVPTELLKVLAGHLHRTMRMQAEAREQQRSDRPAARPGQTG